MKKTITLLLTLALNTFLYTGQASIQAQTIKLQTGFYENKGQITDQNYVPNPNVKYLFCSSGFNVQLRQIGFSYDTYSDETCGGHVTRNYHRVDVELQGCNTDAELSADGESSAYYNYFSAGIKKGGVRNVHFYNNVTYKNIYPILTWFFKLRTKKQWNIIS